MAPESDNLINPVPSLSSAVPALAPPQTNVSAVEETAPDCQIPEAPSAADDIEMQQRIPAAGSESNGTEDVIQLEIPSLPPSPRPLPSTSPSPSLSLPPVSSSPPLPPPPHVERELRRLRDFNHAGLRQMTDELPAKRRRK